ncbi:MAG: hypothetical protein E7300_12700 [Lachnospiraceae bacterium]|nr:hypothetical protein [Lachnospiraceae bacterium]
MFSPEVIEQLQYYVYRLIDPRNGQTFYVGKGKGNRVFAHVEDALRSYNGESYEDNEEDEISSKIQQIRDIKNAGLNVLHVIQRYGLTEKEAFEVEAALIDAYGELTNIQSGHASDRGVNNAEVLQRELSYEEYEEPDLKYIIIKINNRVLEERGNDIYETTRRAWKVNLRKIDDYKYCLAVLNGVVKNVYYIQGWRPDHNANTGRYEFHGEEAPSEIRDLFVNKRIPAKYRKKGMAAPVLYHD